VISCCERLKGDRYEKVFGALSAISVIEPGIGSAAANEVLLACPSSSASHLESLKHP
jgi:hypothetical protein